MLATFLPTRDATCDAPNVVSVDRVVGGHLSKVVRLCQFPLRANVVVLYRRQRHEADLEQNSGHEDNRHR